MNDIQLLNFNDKAIRSYILTGKPCFSRNDIASVLWYARPGKDIIDYIPENLKQSYEITPVIGKQRQEIIRFNVIKLDVDEFAC